MPRYYPAYRCDLDQTISCYDKCENRYSAHYDGSFLAVNNPNEVSNFASDGTLFCWISQQRLDLYDGVVGCYWLNKSENTVSYEDLCPRKYRPKGFEDFIIYFSTDLLLHPHATPPGLSKAPGPGWYLTLSATIGNVHPIVKTFTIWEVLMYAFYRPYEDKCPKGKYLYIERQGISSPKSPFRWPNDFVNATAWIENKENPGTLPKQIWVTASCFEKAQPPSGKLPTCTIFRYEENYYFVEDIPGIPQKQDVIVEPIDWFNEQCGLF